MHEPTRAPHSLNAPLQRSIATGLERSGLPDSGRSVASAGLRSGNGSFHQEKQLSAKTNDGMKRGLRERVSPAVGGAAFTGMCLSFVLLVAAVALAAPIGVKVLAVLLLAGPHNWLEFRFFLSRLPARWKGGNERSFFLLSFAGVALLAGAYIPLMLSLYAGTIEWNFARELYRWWATSVCLWTAALFLLAGRASIGAKSKHLKGLYLPLMAIGALALSGFAVTQPIYFGVALVFAHPLVSFAILDREIARHRPQWLFGLRCGFALVPVLIGSFWWHLQGLSFTTQGAIAEHIVRQTGAPSLPFMSSYFLLSSLVFLDLLHYAVWMIAIPKSSAGWKGLQPRSFPVITRFPKLKLPVQIVFAATSLMVLFLWCAFSSDYVATSQFYFVFAIAHVLAEIPFLAWSSSR